MNFCSVEGCEKRCFGLGLCQAHYAREHREKARESQRKWIASNPEAFRASYLAGHKRWRDANKTKRVAHNTLWRAINCGKIDRLTVLSECSHDAKKENHHPDYLKPLEIMRLCKECHRIADRERREREQAA